MKRRSRNLLAGALFIIIVLLYFIYPSKGVPILAYHQINDSDEIYCVSPVDFAQQMSYLKDNGYTAITLAQLRAYMLGEAVLPNNPIVITFDDGYEDNYTIALPILEKYGLKATVFVISDSVGQPGYLSWDQLTMMIARGTEIQSHTASHVALGEVDVPTKQQEVSESKKNLEQRLGRPVEFLAYPFGSFDAETVQALKAAGYKGACSGIVGLNRPGGDLYSLKRIGVSHGKLGLWEFRLRLLRAIVYSKLGL
jgi:peptidoglycan/xylan/chitin deacetylase (PgdA/CDA1 family)